EETPLAESRRERVQPLLAIDLEIEQRVEEVEARHPERDCATERPRWPRQPSGDRDPGADRREAVDGPEPEMREPGPALQVRVDDERSNGNRPEPAHDRIELEDGDEEERQRGQAEDDD